MKDEQLVASFGPEHDLAEFVDGCGGPYVLNFVHYDPSRNHLEVTDGKMLMRVPVPSFPADAYPGLVDKPELDPVTEPVLLPMKQLSRVLKVAAANSTAVKPLMNRVRFGLGPKGKDLQHMTFQTTDLELEVSGTVLAGDGKFPSTDKVFPEGSPVVSVKLSPRLLRRLAEYVEKHGAERGAAAIRFDFFKRGDGSVDKDGVRFSFRGNPEAMTLTEGLLMPIAEE